jgi:hypothetical protein
MAGLASADTGATIAPLDRDLDPVIISGAAVRALDGSPLDQLFAYAFHEGTWKQIPVQVDEVTANGTYAATEDGLLDANDEVVFMARDLATQAPPTATITASLPVDVVWYEIEVTNPLAPTQKGWAYLVHSTVLMPAAVTDYVGFDLGFHRINADNYSLGFGVNHYGADFLSLGGSDVEILDRTKLQLDCAIPFICPLNEGHLPLPDDLVKDGPVRVIVRGGQVLAYGSTLRWTMPFTIPSYLSGDIRFSTDFNQAVTGAAYYSAVVPAGVTVDGITDTVPATPRSSWWQLSTISGTLIHIADTASIGGVQFNYYVDSSAWDGSDTGDLRHFGDTGVRIEDPNPSFTYTVGAYVLRGGHPNVGPTYEAEAGTTCAQELGTTLRTIHPWYVLLWH